MGEDEGREPTHPPNGAKEVRPSRAQQTRRGSRASFPDMKDKERLAQRSSTGRVHEEGRRRGWWAGGVVQSSQSHGKRARRC